MSDQLPAGAEVRSAIVWFEGFDQDDDRYGMAVASGGFVDGETVQPAWIEADGSHKQPDDQTPGSWGTRVGVDIERRCFVIEHEGLGWEGEPSRVLLNIDAAAAALQIARIAAGQAGGGT